MKRVLVTGARGFIGRHTLTPLAAAGFETHAITSKGAGPSAHGTAWHTANILDPRETAAVVARVQPSHLLHLAWYTEHGRFWNAPVNVSWTAGSLALLNAFHQHGGRRIVTAGTCVEYGPSPAPCREGETPLVPRTMYGICKHALQSMTTAFAAATGISSAWGRIFLLYGEDEAPNRLVPAVIRALLRGEPARCSHGNQIRDFLDAEDVASAFVALLDSDVGGPVNIGAGQPTTIKQVVETIGRQIGRPELIHFGAIAAAPDDPPVLSADTAKLRTEVGWRPRYDLETGLARAIGWWRQHPDR
jgi:nucleoside-diphosphate-sugar epimerase